MRAAKGTPGVRPRAWRACHRSGLQTLVGLWPSEQMLWALAGTHRLQTIATLLVLKLRGPPPVSGWVLWGPACATPDTAAAGGLSARPTSRESRLWGPPGRPEKTGANGR